MLILDPRGAGKISWAWSSQHVTNWWWNNSFHWSRRLLCVVRQRQKLSRQPQKKKSLTRIADKNETFTSDPVILTYILLIFRHFPAIFSSHNIKSYKIRPTSERAVLTDTESYRPCPIGQNPTVWTELKCLISTHTMYRIHTSLLTNMIYAYPGICFRIYLFFHCCIVTYLHFQLTIMCDGSHHLISSRGVRGMFPRKILKS